MCVPGSRNGKKKNAEPPCPQYIFQYVHYGMCLTIHLLSVTLHFSSRVMDGLNYTTVCAGISLIFLGGVGAYVCMLI